jgi:hypothetical protein
MTFNTWWALAGLLILLAAAATLAVVMRRRQARHERRRILDYLDEVSVNEVFVTSHQDGEQTWGGRGLILRDSSGKISRKLTGFYVAISDPPRRVRLLTKLMSMRFNHAGIPYTLTVRFVTRRRLSRRLRNQLGLEKGRLYRVRSQGEVTNADRREIMRFSFDGSSVQGNDSLRTGDAVRYVSMACSLSLTNLPAPENQKKQERLIAAAPGLTVSDPCTVRVVDFSVTGIQIEGDEELALLLAATSAAQNMERALQRPELVLLTIQASLSLPHTIEDVRAEVPPQFSLLGRIVRAALHDRERSGTFRLAIQFLYEPLAAGGTNPASWRLLGRGIDSEPLAEIHRALNQVAAQLES